MSEITYFHSAILRGGPSGITGCAITRMTEYRDANGNTIAARESDAIPVAIAVNDSGIPLVDVLGEVNAGLLVSVDNLTAHVATLTAERDALVTERDTALSDLATRTAERDALQIGAAAAANSPDEVSSLAFELTLESLGLRNAVLDYIASLPAVEQIYWQRRQTMRRDSQMIESGRVALGLTHEQVDALFSEAAARVV